MPALPLLTALVPLITLLIATVARFAIRIFMKVFDWSTEIFFGKIDNDKTIKLTILSALSMIWIIMILNIPFPVISKFTLAFLPKTIRSNRLVIYLLNGSGAFFIPILVGAICMFWNMEINLNLIKVENIKSVQYKQGILGFYYTFFLGLSFITMFIFSPTIKFISFFKKRKMVLTNATISKGRYEVVLIKLQNALKEYNIDMQLMDLKLMYRVPLSLIGVLADSLFKDIVIKNNKFLFNKELEIYIHHNDIMISGKEDLIKKATTVIFEILMFDTTYLTWSEETQKLEDDLLIIHSDFIISGGTAYNKCLERLEDIRNILKNMVVEYEDLKTLTCQILTLENLILSSKN